MTASELSDLYKNYDKTALCIWREGRGEVNPDALPAIGSCIANTAKKLCITSDQEVMRPLRYSSMTYQNDPQLHVFPKDNDAKWLVCENIAATIKSGQWRDIIGGSTLYYNPNGIISDVTIDTPIGTIKFPDTWNKAKVRWFGQIGKHVFFVEIA